jgi:signal transduction histidine kinase
MNDKMPHEIDSDPTLKELVARERQDLLLSRGKFLVVVGSAFYMLYWALDWITAPDLITVLLLIRLSVAACLAVILILLNSQFGAKFAGGLTILSAYIPMLGVVVMTSMLGGFDSFYYIGIIFILFITGMVFPWTAHQTIICGILTVGSYIGINLIQYTQASSFTPLQPVFFMIGAVAITAFANAEEGRTRRKNIQLRMQIEKANEDLKELDNAKMRFFANVSHELRTPLTLILGPLEAILQGKQDQDFRPLLQAMEANARRLLRHVNALLDFAKIDAGKIECNYEYDNLGKILQDLSVAAKPHLLNRKIDLVLEDWRFYRI